MKKLPGRCILFIFLFLLPNLATSEKVIVVPMVTREPAADFSTVISNGRVWMDRNLGAMRQSLSPEDDASYGGYFQWGRANDGHAWPLSATETTPSSEDDPGHGRFILGSSWRFPQNDELWQGVDEGNNPCPPGFRLPTYAELSMEISSWNSQNAYGAFRSPLRLAKAGFRHHSDGVIHADGSGEYWTSTVNGIFAWYLYITDGQAEMDYSIRTTGKSVRCIQE